MVKFSFSASVYSYLYFTKTICRYTKTCCLRILYSLVQCHKINFSIHFRQFLVRMYGLFISNLTFSKSIIIPQNIQFLCIFYANVYFFYVIVYDYLG